MFTYTRFWGFGRGAWSLGFRAWGLGFRVWGTRVHLGLGFRRRKKERIEQAGAWFGIHVHLKFGAVDVGD